LIWFLLPIFFKRFNALFKTLNLIVCFFSLIVLTAQEEFPFSIDHACSRSKQFHNSFLESKNIYQSPLLFYYDVNFYFLDLNVENNSIYIAGNVTIQAKVSHLQLDTVAFELVDELIIDSIFVNDFQKSFVRSNDEVFVPLLNPLFQDEQFTFQIFYHGTPPTGGFFSGISTEYDSIWNKNVTWTLSEPFNARQWWPTKQVLTDKADSVWVYITTSAQNKAGSIGLLSEEISLPNNKVRFEWKSKYPIAYYLISFAVAEYQEYNIYAKPSDLLGDSILIQNYIYDSPGCLNHFKYDIDNTVNFLELFSDLFSGYPFLNEKYGHCLAVLSGGMEHQTMTTLGRFDFSLVAHELGHMWFGDNVTCSNWSDIWINEGFATYADYLATDMIAGGQWPGIWKKNVHNYILSEPGGSIYVPEDEITYDNVDRIFDSRLTYFKGAIMLHMIRFELNSDELFFTVLKNFQEQFADSLASAPDFIKVLNETTGKDFNDFFEQWYYGEGYPIYSITYKQNGNELTIGAIQTSSMPEITPFYKMKMPYKLFFSDGTDSTVILHQESNSMNFTLPVSKKIDSIQVDPEKWTLKKVESIFGISENSSANYFSLTPNPVDERLNIHYEGGVINQITIRNLYGIKIKEMQTMQPISFISVSELNPGVYFITINVNSSNFTLKFIKL
jgi:aminopeptidase N